MEVSKYWSDAYDDLCAVRGANDCVIAMVDANCRLGLREEDDVSLGDFLDPPNTHNFVSDAFAFVCRRSQLAVTGTFSHNRSGKGPVGSFYAASGLTLSCDYVAVSKHVAVEVKELLMNNKKATTSR